MTRRKMRQEARRQGAEGGRQTAEDRRRTTDGRGQRADDRGQNVGSTGPMIIATGRISSGVKETRITFQSMSPLGQAAVRRVFGENISRAEEIVNA